MIDYLKIGAEVAITVVAVYIALRERLVKLEMRTKAIEDHQSLQSEMNQKQEQELNDLKTNMKVTSNILANIEKRLSKGDHSIEELKKSIQELNVNIKELSVNIEHLKK